MNQSAYINQRFILYFSTQPNFLELFMIHKEKTKHTHTYTRARARARFLPYNFTELPQKKLFLETGSELKAVR
jgi:hypothetical protein